MRASHSKPFLHFPVAAKSNLVVSVCLPCRRIVAAAPLGVLTKIEQEHMGTSNRHAAIFARNAKPKLVGSQSGRSRHNLS